MPAPAQVPVVDISAFAHPSLHTAAERTAVAAEWDAAMSGAGFAQVSGHGVPGSLLTELRAAAAEFFGRAPEEKMGYNHGPYGNQCGGFTEQGVESVGRTFQAGDSTGGGGPGDAAAAKPPPPDLVENYVLRGRPEQWGADPSSDPGALPAHAPELAVVGPRYFRALGAPCHARTPAQPALHCTALHALAQPYVCRCVPFRCFRCRARRTYAELHERREPGAGSGVL